MDSKSIERLSSSKSSFVDYPKTAVVLPRKVAEKVVLWVDVVSKGACTKEGVYVAAIRELT